MLKLENISKSYREGDSARRVLDGLSLEVAPGELVSLLGTSGSGKSTLLNLICGIDRPDSGCVLLAEKDLTQMSEVERTLHRRRHIGFVFQFFNLIPTLTVAENVRLPLELNGLETEGERVDALLAQVGLEGRQRSYPEHLSGGEQQRVALARALVHQPSLVLADEPTGNLDEETGRGILSLLEELTREHGRSVIMVTHSAEAARIGHRTLRLKAGRLVEVEDGTDR